VTAFAFAFLAVAPLWPFFSVMLDFVGR